MRYLLNQKLLWTQTSIKEVQKEHGRMSHTNELCARIQALKISVVGGCTEKPYLSYISTSSDLNWLGRS